MALLQARSVRESQLDEVKSKFCPRNGRAIKVAVVAVVARGEGGLRVVVTWWSALASAVLQVVDTCVGAPGEHPTFFPLHRVSARVWTTNTFLELRPHRETRQYSSHATIISVPFTNNLLSIQVHL